MQLATTGSGTHYALFSWTNSFGQIFSVKFKGKSRNEIAETLKKFKRATERLRKRLETETLKAVEEDIRFKQIVNMITFGESYEYEWLAIQCPTVEIKTVTKTGELYKKKWLFNYKYYGFVTWRTYQRELKKVKKRVAFFDD